MAKKRSPNTTWVPRDAPGGTPRVWEETVPGRGTFYFHGVVVRKGVRSYLVRRDPTVEENATAVCLIGEDGKVIKWYSAWESKALAFGLRDTIDRAGQAAIVHSVMTT